MKPTPDGLIDKTLYYPLEYDRNTACWEACGRRERTGIDGALTAINILPVRDIDPDE